MKVHELGIPRLETTMARLLQRPDEMQVEDVRDLIDCALGCLKRGNLLMSNLLVVELARNLQTAGHVSENFFEEILAGYGEMLEEVFSG